MCVLCRRGGEAVARCTTQIVADLNGAPGRSGLIGHYESFVPEAGIALLLEARDALAAASVTRVLGPMNRQHVGALSPGAARRTRRPRVRPPPVPRRAALIRSTIPSTSRSPGSRWRRVARPRRPSRRRGRAAAERRERRRPSKASRSARCSTSGASTTSWRAVRDEPRGLRGQPYYHADRLRGVPALQPAPASAPRSRLRPARATIRGGRLVAYHLAYPDPLSATDGRPTRIVVKTVAARPDARGKGLGQHLLDRIRALAHDRGYREVVHALMHVAGFSMRMSARRRARSSDATPSTNGPREPEHRRAAGRARRPPSIGRRSSMTGEAGRAGSPSASCRARSRRSPRR